MFQSPPGPQAGATQHDPAVKGYFDAFQSPPGPQAGRYKDHNGTDLITLQVSIPARPAGRALPDT